MLTFGVGKLKDLCYIKTTIKNLKNKKRNIYHLYSVIYLYIQLGNSKLLLFICDSPLYSNKKKQTSMIGMKDGDGRDDEIFKHISIATSKYPDIDIKEAILFLNKEIFNDPLDETIVLNKIERAKQNYLENPFTFYKKIYNGTQLSDDGPKEFNIVCFDNIKTEIPKWLWYPYLPLGTIVLLVGDPGVGKTYIALWIASLISNGQEFPFNEENKNEKIGPSNVLFQNGEDGVSYTLKLRLENLGANSKNIYMIDESQSMFHLNDLSLFEETLKRLRPKLVIIDPIQRYIPTGKSMDKANDVRSALSPIRDLAEKYECTVLIIMHRNKGNSNGKIPSLYRALGSIDFVGTAGGMLTAEQTNKGKVVYQTKNPLGVIGEPLMYEISDDGFKIIGKFKDNGANQDNDKKIDIAKKFILSKIKDEPMLSTELLYQALENDISQSTYDRARKEIGTVSIQNNNQWYTCLDEKSAKIFKEKLKENAKNY